MNDIRLSFEHKWEKVVGDRYWLSWDEQFQMYKNPDVNLAWKWYCLGYLNGERG